MKSKRKPFFSFGEEHKSYDVRVLNEREARAAAGIMLFLAVIAFGNAWFVQDFFYLKMVVVAFFVDFFIRVLINPRFAPSLILGRLIVSKQNVEYTGAPQKRFAWALGLGLASFMLVRVVIMGLFGPVNLIICLICLLLLFFETAFGICIGCKMYNLVNKEKAKLCPGGACEIRFKEEIQQVNYIQYAVLGLAIAALVAGYFMFGV